MWVWDEDNLALAALVIFLIQLTYFLLTYIFALQKLSDVAAGTNFIIIVLLTLFLGNTFFLRQLIVTCLVIVWGVRLSSYLLFRIVKIGHDDRFTKDSAASQIAGFWAFQAVWVYGVALSVTFINSPASSGHPNAAMFGTPNDIIGLVFYGIGLVLETFADMQKYYFKENTDNDGKWCTYGMWKWSRHPNYFGEILLWWGIFIIGSSTYTVHQWSAVISPVFTSAILMFLSGVPLLEKKADDRYGDIDDYLDYKRNTSVLVPIPPNLYRSLPRYCKMTLCCDLIIYDFTETDPLLDGPVFV